MWANGGITMFVASFRVNIDAGPYTDVTCRELAVHYKEMGMDSNVIFHECEA